LQVKRGWNWDFEEESRARGPSLSAPVPTPATDSLARKVQLRRRRGVAVLVLLIALAALLATALGSHRHPTRAVAGHNAGAAGGAARGAAASAATTRSGADAVKDVLAYTPFVRVGAERGHEAALTFDDGPGPYTPGVLAVLEREHAPATFFAIGKMERYFSASTEREIADGDVVGDHTQSHRPLATLSAHEQREELFEGMVRIELAGGPRPLLFRPPYGSFNATTFRELHSLGMLMVLWSVDTKDYQQPGAPAIVESVLAGARPGAIFLMHDGGGDRSQTIAALPTIIRDLRARGLKLVTVPQLLRDDPPPAGEPAPRSLAGD
jgi:peptidoglycan-N-acetylglucosamine deacetylase